MIDVAHQVAEMNSRGYMTEPLLMVMRKLNLYSNIAKLNLEIGSSMIQLPDHFTYSFKVSSISNSYFY